METLALEEPQTITHYKVTALHLDWSGQSIGIIVIDGIGKTSRFQYAGSTAVQFMTILNKADLSVKSLHSRILTQLVADGYLPAGTVAGTPD